MSSSKCRQVAINLLNRARGASIEALSKRTGRDERQVRNLIDNLRRGGLGIENVGPCRFKIVEA